MSSAWMDEGEKYMLACFFSDSDRHIGRMPVSDMKRSGMELLHFGLDNSITYPAQRSVRRGLCPAQRSVRKGWQDVIIREK